MLRQNKSFQRLVDCCYNKLTLEELCGGVWFYGMRGFILRVKIENTCELLLSEYFSTDPYDKDFEYLYGRLIDRLENSRILKRI